MVTLFFENGFRVSVHALPKCSLHRAANFVLVQSATQLLQESAKPFANSAFLQHVDILFSKRMRHHLAAVSFMNLQSSLAIHMFSILVWHWKVVANAAAVRAEADCAPSKAAAFPQSWLIIRVTSEAQTAKPKERYRRAMHCGSVANDASLMVPRGSNAA